MARAPLLDKATETAWATKAHLYVLDALMAETAWRTKDIAFHGGTSLHLSWRSPRHSEDLDFLLANDVGDVSSIMRSVVKRVQERFMLQDPSVNVAFKERTKDSDRMVNFQVTVSSPHFTGKAMVKAEFWKVDREYLERYPVEFRTPLSAGDVVSSVSHPIPAARLDTAFCDKLTAFATRPFLKWRDVFDIWWIGTQTRERLDLAEVASQFLHNVSAYDTRNGLSPSAALRDFLERTDDEIFAEAGRDLRPWVSDALWDRLYPDMVRQMVVYTRHALTTVSDHIDGLDVSDDPDILKRVPR